MLATNHVRTTILPNGLTVLTERMEHVRSVSMGVWLTTGARHDAPEHNGLSHFVEHMVFKGTTTRSARRISLDTDELGGYMNAFTAQDMVAFHATVLDTHVTRALDLLADLILNPEFVPAEIEREREVILEEINATQDDPVYLAHDAFIRTLWKDDPISLPIGGTPETLGSFTRDTLVRYAKDHFTGRNMVFVAAGNLQHDDMVEKVKQCFGRAPAGTPLPRGAFPKASAGSTLIDKPSEQVQLLIGVPAPPLTDGRYFTAHLAAMVLGGGPSSRLFQSVREQRGLAYSITADYMPYHNTGYFSVYCGTSRTRVRPVLRPHPSGVALPEDGTRLAKRTQARKRPGPQQPDHRVGNNLCPSKCTGRAVPGIRPCRQFGRETGANRKRHRRPGDAACERAVRLRPDCPRARWRH